MTAPLFFFFESAFKVHCVLAPVSDWGKNPLSQAWSNFIFLMENYIAHGSAWSLCVLVKPASRAPRGLFFCLSSAFVVWNVQVVHAHLQICLLHKSLSFSIVVMGGGWGGGWQTVKKVLFEPPPAASLSCALGLPHIKLNTAAMQIEPIRQTQYNVFNQTLKE